MFNYLFPAEISLLSIPLLYRILYYLYKYAYIKVTLQIENNNLVIKDQNNKIIWDSQTNLKGKGSANLIMQDDRNLVLYDENLVVCAKNYR